MKQADSPAKTADVCLILEGTYPYVTGGVSTWTHDLLLAQHDLSFHLVLILAPKSELKMRYEVPRNVLSTTHVYLQAMPAGSGSPRKVEAAMKQLESPLERLQLRGGFADLKAVLDVVAPSRKALGKDALLNSPQAWEMLLRMYKGGMPESSFLDYFWSWRALLGGLYSVLHAPLQPARVYHTVSTGYAGLYAARARAETGRPALLTEHGIYTNERRIEMAMATWLHEAHTDRLQIDTPRRALKDLWVDTFIGYSKACYEACSEIITLYGGNQQLQLQDGAPREKLKIIPNGIDWDRYSGIVQDTSPRPATVALIGRVVAIKDIKTFIRAAGLLRAMVPDVQMLVLGPTDEEKEYCAECLSLVEHLNLKSTVHFLGRVNLAEYLGKIDVVVLTSISEAQPLVILEAGAVGLPIVATDVGACREMLHGGPNEEPLLGPAGEVTPLCNPAATAQAIGKLLLDSNWYEECSRNIRARVQQYYNKAAVDRTYRELYEKYGKQ
jgi:glycosyltransferase involved in cell wall biosynthesis